MAISPGIIFLNGTSSAGKSTVAKALQERLDGVWLHVTLDLFFNLLPSCFLDNPRWADGFDWDQVLDGFHRAVAQLPKTGYPVILDHVCTSHRWQRQCVELFADYTVLYVGVTCPLDELQRRELQRGDRKIGVAEEHLVRYQQAGPFDLEINTKDCAPVECAEKILAAIERLEHPTTSETMAAASGGKLTQC